MMDTEKIIKVKDILFLFEDGYDLGYSDDVKLAERKIESIPENETLTSRVKGSMSLYIYKKLGEWLGAPCNLSFGELRVGDFFTRYCGDFCDYDCEYEKCWKKFFETLEETEASDESVTVVSN